MASIPCAAYQASHIHAHMRRHDLQARARHNSSASTDSTAEDTHQHSNGCDPKLSTNAGPLAGLANSQGGASITLSQQTSIGSNPPDSPLQNQGFLWDKMDQVSHWVGNSFRRLAHPYLPAQPMSQPTPGGLADKVSENNLTAATSQTVVKSET